jgi:acyl-coenzyme A thioesterase PaaI-like protein
VPESDPTRRFLPNSDGCFVCGAENPAGLQTRFYVDGDTVCMPLTARETHCGYPNTVHGGVLAAALDECMGWAAARSIQRMCLTGELTVRYLQRVPLSSGAVVRAEVVRAHRRMVHTTAEIVGPDGTVHARAEGRFLPLSVEETLRVDAALRYDGDEERIFAGLRPESDTTE